MTYFPSIRVTKKTILAGTLLCVLVFGLLTLFLLRAERICIARTAVAPAPALYSDPVAFQAMVANTRAHARGALIRQFDTATGLFVYSANPNGAVSTNDNEVRQLLASRVLAQESAADETLLPLHKQNLETIFSTWYQEDEKGNGFVLVDGASKLGANAMLLRVLVASPFFDAYREQAAHLARGMIALQDSDGAFKPWYREPAYTYDADYLLTFYSGEALLSLVEYANKTGDRTVLAAAEKSQDFYVHQYVDTLEANYYPAYVPWHTQSLALLYERTGDARYADAIFILNDKLLEIQDTTDYIGRFYNSSMAQYGSPHASSDAVYTEGLAVAYRVTIAREDVERQATYRDALVRAVHNLSRLQYSPTGWLFDNAAASRRLVGGIKTNACSRWIRIDTTAHAVDALSVLDAVLSADDH